MLARTIVFHALIVPGLWLATVNAAVAFKTWILRQRSPSWVPLVGGACIRAAALAGPYPTLARYWWAGLVIDWGSLPGLLHTLAWLASRRYRQHSR